MMTQDRSLLLHLRLLLTPARLLFVILQNNKDHNTSARPPKSQTKENTTNLPLSPLRIRLRLPFSFGVLPAILRCPLLGRRLRLGGEEPVEPSLLFAIQEFCELVGTFVDAVFAVSL